MTSDGSNVTKVKWQSTIVTYNGFKITDFLNKFGRNCISWKKVFYYAYDHYIMLVIMLSVNDAV